MIRPLLIALALLGAMAWPAAADDPEVTSSDTGYVVHGMAETEDERDVVQTSGTQPDGTWHEERVCRIGGQETCNQLATCDDGTVMVMTWFETPDGTRLNQQTNCPEAEDGSRTPTVTPGDVLRALRAIDLPEANLVIQPPNGRTLVNFETNFYTEQGELTPTVPILGSQVELRIWPASFVWRFGDGETLESTSPGAPYPDLDITHSYRDKGQVAPSVDVTYAAEFRVDGGRWQDVPGTVTIAGTPQSLRVVTARPVLIGG